MIVWDGAGWDVYFTGKLVLQNVADMALDKATLSRPNKTEKVKV